MNSNSSIRFLALALNLITTVPSCHMREDSISAGCSSVRTLLPYKWSRHQEGSACGKEEGLRSSLRGK